MPLSIKLPPHNTNLLDDECLRGSDEDYFIKRMKKLTPEKINNDAAQVCTGHLPFGRFNGAERHHTRRKRYLTGDDS